MKIKTWKKFGVVNAAVVLIIAIMFSEIFCVCAVEDDIATPVSQIIKNKNGVYIEHLGEPYLMYGVQMRLDWQYEDKIILEYPKTEKDKDWDWIEENFQKVVSDGFKSVAIPVNWSYIEQGTEQNHYYDFYYLEKLYDYIYKYDLTVQWLWFGTNVCGVGAYTVPTYIRNNTTKYSRLKNIEYDIKKASDKNGNVSYVVNGYNEVNTLSPYMNFSDHDTMIAEQNALAATMEYISQRDTEKRCVMIQVDNEVDQGGNYWLPQVTLDNGSVLRLDDWWTTAEKHNKYCWAFGQRDAVFSQLNELGNIVHNSSYNCVTRVNFSAGGRSTIGNANSGYGGSLSTYNTYTSDYDDLLSLGGIDIIGVDCYAQEWDGVQRIENNICTALTKIDGNLMHLAESSAGYDSSINTSRLFELGAGNIIYSHRADREALGMYETEMTNGVYNRKYKEWIDLPSTPLLREYNHTINKAYFQIAKAVSNKDFIYLTENNQKKSVDDISFTLNSKSAEQKLALAFKSADEEFVLMSVKTDCEIFMDCDKIISAEIGHYDFNTGYWKKEKNAILNDKTISLQAGQTIRVIVNKIIKDFPITSKNVWTSNFEYVSNKDGEPAYVLTDSKSNNNRWGFLTKPHEDDCFSTRIYFSEGFDNIWFRMRNFDSWSGAAIKSGYQIYLYPNRCQIWYYGIENGTPSSQYIIKTVDFEESLYDKWIDIDFIMVDNYLVVLIDNYVVFSINNIYYNTANNLYNQIMFNSNQENNLYFSMLRTYSTIRLSQAISAIDSISFGDDYNADKIQRLQAIEAYQKLDSKYQSALPNYDKYLDSYYFCGDVNMDGTINLLDIVRLKKVLAQICDANIKSDIDRNGAISSDDLILLIKLLIS